jgi:hypothetical protein
MELAKNTEKMLSPNKDKTRNRLESDMSLSGVSLHVIGAWLDWYDKHPDKSEAVKYIRQRSNSIQGGEIPLSLEAPAATWDPTNKPQRITRPFDIGVKDGAVPIVRERKYT